MCRSRPDIKDRAAEDNAIAAAAADAKRTDTHGRAGPATFVAPTESMLDVNEVRLERDARLEMVCSKYLSVFFRKLVDAGTRERCRTLRALVRPLTRYAASR